MPTRNFFKKKFRKGQAVTMPTRKISKIKTAGLYKVLCQQAKKFEIFSQYALIKLKGRPLSKATFQPLTYLTTYLP